MPTAREVVPNTKLTGSELKTILRADFERLLDNEGMLSAHIAFGRVSYAINLKMHVDNPFHPESEIAMASRQVGTNLVAADAKLGAIEPVPLADPSLDASVAATKLQRNITSPNAERVRHGLPVPAIRTQQDGTTITEKITYPKESLPDLPDEDVAITDTSAQAAQEWGQPVPQTHEEVVADLHAEFENNRQCKCGHLQGNHALSGICTKCGEATCAAFRDASIPDATPEGPQAWPVVPGDGSEATS
jgi:hypothetical protein